MTDVDWESIREKLPTDRTKDATEKRDKLFDEFDPNNNGYLSLAEVDKGCRDVLGIESLFESKKVIMRAFQAAKFVSKAQSTYGPDYVERSEFRLLLVYLRQYFELWQMFISIDASTSDGSTPSDRRISLDEFVAVVPQLNSWGLSSLTDSSAPVEFESIDTNNGGYVLFDEFSNWAIMKQLDLQNDTD